MFSEMVRWRGVLLCCLGVCMLVCALCAEGKDAAPGTAGGVYDVTRYGAAGDSAMLNTTAIQAAIDEAANQGGGEVLFPPGAFITGTLYLKNHVLLRLAHGATVLGSTNLADYPVNHCKYPSRSDQYTVRALIWGEGLEDVGITGSGAIDGQGVHFRDNEGTPEQVAESSRPFEAEGRYPLHKIYLNRPYLIRLISCRNVLVENVTLRNSAMWMQHYLDCDFVTLRGLNVVNHVCANNDMIDIDGCRNVIVSDCIGDTDDDALTLKSTGARATEHVVISNCILRSHCNAIKAGTESAGGFRDIAISNCVIQRSEAGTGRSGRPKGLAGIALEIVDGGTLERVSISNIVMEGTTAPIFMRLGNRARPPKPSDPKPPVGAFRDVSISNVVATGAGRTGCAVAGLPGHPIENVTFSNVRISFTGGGIEEDGSVQVPEQEDKYPESTMFGALPAYGFYFRHVRELRLRDLELRYETPDLRPAIVADDVSDFRLELLSAEAQSNARNQIVLRDVQHALITGCSAAATGALVGLDGACADIRLLHNDLGRARQAYVLSPATPLESMTAAFNLLPEAACAARTK